MSTELVSIYRAQGFVKYIIQQIYCQSEIYVLTLLKEMVHNVFILMVISEYHREQVTG